MKVMSVEVIPLNFSEMDRHKGSTEKTRSKLRWEY